MSDQPEALRLAGWLDSLDVRTIDKIQNVVSSAAELRRQHSRIEAGEALMPMLLDALEDITSGWKYIRSMHGDLYGVGWDRAQDKADNAITALRARLESSK